MGSHKRQKDAVGNRGSRKLGRNSAKCKAYKSRGQRERNKERRAKRIQNGFRSLESRRPVG